jgi:SAM-dependent methyltransferase
MAAIFGRARSARFVLRKMVRHRPRLHALIRLLKYGPVMGRRDQRARRELMRSARDHDWLLLYLGSGGRRQPGMVNLDITPDTGPDVVGDGFRLPFPDATFDAIFCEYVVEHVGDAEAFLRAASKALKRGGLWYLEVPFLQPIHAGGEDFARWTERGFALAAQRCGLEVLRSGSHLGPSFTLFWLMKQTLATLAAFGSARTENILIYIFGWLFSPVLLLDWAVKDYNKYAMTTAGYYFVLRTK